ncbi:MAG: hypothetical protein ABJC60_07180 [Actinomycetota bacterium]
MVGFILAALATAWTTIAGDAVIESTLDASDRLVLFGRTMVLTSPTIEVFACVALGMSVAVVITAWIQGSVQWRHEVKMRAEVNKRWEEISTRNAGMEGRNELLEWRLHDLQDQVDALAARRDALLSDTQRDLEEAKEAVRATRSRDSLRHLQDSMVVLPDLEGDGSDQDSAGSAQDDDVTTFPA